MVISCRGEAGIGKTALLDRLAGTQGATVLRGRGVPGESSIPYAALQLLTQRHHAAIRALATPEREALLAAVSLADPDAVDPHLLAAATHRLLSVLAAEAPVLCLIDDAQWIDDRSLAALCGAGRMLDGQSVALVFTADDSWSSPLLSDFIAHRLHPLETATAHALLRRQHPRLADRTREAIVAESSGNPRAIHEFAAALPGPVGRGRHPHALRRYRIHALPAPRRLCEALDTGWDGLDPSARWALLRAAVDGTGRLSIITDDPRVLDPAVDAGLIRHDDETLRFVHPLLRSAIYQRVPRHHRLLAHRRQAEALEHTSHTEQRLWHRAAAATGPDEALATALESSTRTPSIRDCAAELAFTWERAANLSATPRRRTRRLLAAATAAVDAGDLAHATVLLDQATPLTGSATERATVTRLRAAVEAVSGSSRKAAADALLAVDSTPGLIDAARYAWDSADTTLLAEITGRLATVDAPAGSDAELLIQAVTGASLLAGGSFQDGQRLVTAAFGDLGDPRESDRPPQTLSLLASAAASVGADDCGLACVETALRRWRHHGAIGRLPRAMLTRAVLLWHCGQTAAAVATADRARDLAAELGQRQVVDLIDLWSLLPTAMRGDVDDYDALVRGFDPAERPGIASVPTRFTAEVAVLLDLAQRRHTAALWRCATAPDADITAAVGLAPSYVEAAVGAGQDAEATAALASIEAHARYSTQDWIRAVAARCRALTAAGDRAEEHYRRAVDLHRDGSRPLEHARTRLLYGEWLRRRLRHSDAQRELDAAHEIFVRLGAHAWARRAHGELSAARKRNGPDGGQCPPIANLTPQETQVVGLAAAGYSNREIGARLTLSPRTVGYHLYKSFPKLGVSSRHELSRVLNDLPS